MIERSVYMSIWDDYKTSVRTRINVKQDRLLLTERQWKLKHYVKLNDKCGKYLWVNAYCPNQELYLWDEEVRKMTDEELATYRAEEKEKRVARAKRRELKTEFDKLKKQKLDKSSTERRSFNMIKAMRNKIINNSVCIAKTVNIALYDYKENFVADFITDFGIRKTIKMSKKNLQKMFNWKEAVEFLKFINYDKDMYEKFIRYFFPDKLEYLSLVKENEVIVVDTETTGLNPETDELLQVSIIDVKICYSQYAKGLVTKCEVICALIYTICIPCCFIPPISTESSTSTQSIEITEFKIIKNNKLKVKGDYFFDTNEYSYTTADNIVYNNVKVDTWGGITDGSITSIEVQNNTPKKLIITENKNFDLRSFFIITTYEYTFV